ncbi:hypothetical protein D9M69_641210 [compost metagenome]
MPMSSVPACSRVMASTELRMLTVTSTPGLRLDSRASSAGSRCALTPADDPIRTTPSRPSDFLRT